MHQIRNTFCKHSYFVPRFFGLLLIFVLHEQTSRIYILRKRWMIPVSERIDTSALVVMCLFLSFTSSKGAVAPTNLG